MSIFSKSVNRIIYEFLDIFKYAYITYQMLKFQGMYNKNIARFCIFLVVKPQLRTLKTLFQRGSTMLIECNLAMNLSSSTQRGVVSL